MDDKQRIEFSLLDDKERYAKFMEKRSALDDKVWNDFNLTHKLESDSPFRKKIKDDNKVLHREINKLSKEGDVGKLREGFFGYEGESGVYRRGRNDIVQKSLAPDPKDLTKQIRKNRSGLKLVGNSLKGIAALGILSASDMASAAVDHVVPGGVEDMGVSAEQKDLDKRYQETLRRRSLNQK